MNRTITNSLLLWVISFLTSILFAFILAHMVGNGSKQDFQYVWVFTLTLFIPLTGAVSGLLSYREITHPLLSSGIATVLSMIIGYELRHDIGLNNTLLGTLKECVMQLPLSYFCLGYFLPYLLKKIKNLLLSIF